MNKMERAAEAWARCVARVGNEFDVEESLAFYAEELADILEGTDEGERSFTVTYIPIEITTVQDEVV